MWAQLFLDAVSAFASLQRKIAIPGDNTSEELWMRHLVGSGLSYLEACDVMELACSALVWSNAGASEHAVCLMRNTHALTWFTVEGLKGATRFVKGTAAGTPLADLMFVCAMAKLLTKLEACLSSSDLVHTFSAVGAVGLLRVPRSKLLDLPAVSKTWL